MRRLKEKEACALLFCASIWLLAGFLIFPHAAWQAAAEQAHAEQADASQKIVAIENFMNAHGNMDEFCRELERHQENSLKAMPEELEQGKFLEFLQRMAIHSHVELMGVVPGEKVCERDLVRLPIQVNFKCSYFELLDFLQGLQEGERFLQVRNAKVHSDKGKLVCEIDLTIFAMGL